MRIALATAEHLPELSPDDQVLLRGLRERGIAAEPVIWDSDTDWSQYDSVVVRSIWDYHLKYARYRTWLAALEASGTPVHNPVETLRWNADKHYLLDLEARGVRITPTRVVERGAARTLRAVLAETGWQHAVVKPTVSSTGYETWFVDTPCSDADEARFAAQTAGMAVLVQEFAGGVHGGELSFVFIAGNYSHAIIKRPAEGEFRVHIEHGGSVDDFDATPEQIAWARDVVAAMAEHAWTYARVDAVIEGGAPMLMELELLDPELFLLHNEAAAHALADACCA